MKLRSLLISMLVISSIALLQADQPVAKGKVKVVSLLRVIANPEQFDGQRVRLLAFLDYGCGLDESLCLYVSQADGRNYIATNSINIGKLSKNVKLIDPKLIGRYVEVQGTFRTRPEVELEEYGSGIHAIHIENGMLDDIDAIRLWERDESRSR